MECLRAYFFVISKDFNFDNPYGLTGFLIESTLILLFIFPYISLDEALTNLQLYLFFKITSKKFLQPKKLLLSVSFLSKKDFVGELCPA